MPPLLGPLLTGPVPPWAARFATHWPAVGAALIAPLVIGIVFLRAPVLPNSAVEVGDRGGPVRVVRGQLIAVDDTSTTILQSGGQVTFVPNEQVRSKTLCPEPERGPDSVVVVRGWPAESSALEWVAPTMRVADVDPRCLGRPLKPGMTTFSAHHLRRAAYRVQTGWTRPGRLHAMTLHLRWAAVTDQGHVRSNNQDAFYAGDRLLVVADGMGGMAAGDVASRLAVDAMASLDVAIDNEHQMDALHKALEVANGRIAETVAGRRRAAGHGHHADRGDLLR